MIQCGEMGWFFLHDQRLAAPLNTTVTHFLKKIKIKNTSILFLSSISCNFVIRRAAVSIAADSHRHKITVTSTKKMNVEVERANDALFSPLSFFHLLKGAQKTSAWSTYLPRELLSLTYVLQSFLCHSLDDMTYKPFQMRTALLNDMQ